MLKTHHVVKQSYVITCVVRASSPDSAIAELYSAAHWIPFRRRTRRSPGDRSGPHAIYLPLKCGGQHYLDTGSSSRGTGDSLNRQPPAYEPGVNGTRQTSVGNLCERPVSAVIPKGHLRSYDRRQLRLFSSAFAFTAEHGMKRVIAMHLRHRAECRVFRTDGGILRCTRNVKAAIPDLAAKLETAPASLSNRRSVFGRPLLTVPAVPPALSGEQRIFR